SSKWDILDIADFNGDGKSDILAQRKTDGNLYTILLNEDGTSATINKIMRNLASSKWDILDIADFNGDGKSDILAQRKTDGNLYTILLNEDGTSATINKIMRNLVSSKWDIINTADFNGDGRSDVLAQRKTDGNLYTLLLNEDGTSVTTNKIMSHLLSDKWDILDTLDFNGDGKTDVLLQRKSDGNIYTLTLDNNGTSATINNMTDNLLNGGDWTIF
ncbi:MAG: VCBS repeat-containing protein, partial [Sulfurovaceae bacterium]|nr:VCBS repeat-containing protein [Sulfurovaceae bacterium]